MKILSSLNMYTFWCELLIFASIFVYFLVLLIENYIPGLDDEIYGIFAPMMSQPITYFALLFMFFSTFTIDKIIAAVRKRVQTHYELKEEAMLE